MKKSLSLVMFVLSLSVSPLCMAMLPGEGDPWVAQILEAGPGYAQDGSHSDAPAFLTHVHWSLFRGYVRGKSVNAVISAADALTPSHSRPVLHSLSFYLLQDALRGGAAPSWYYYARSGEANQAQQTLAVSRAAQFVLELLEQNRLTQEEAATSQFDANPGSLYGGPGVTIRSLLEADRGFSDLAELKALKTAIGLQTAPRCSN